MYDKLELPYSKSVAFFAHFSNMDCAQQVRDGAKTFFGKFVAQVKYYKFAEESVVPSLTSYVQSMFEK